MSLLAGLGFIVLALGIGAGPFLRRGAWSHRLPKVAALAWLGVLAAAIAAAVGMVTVVLTGPARSGTSHGGVADELLASSQPGQ